MAPRKIAVAGVGGRMGRRIAELVDAADDLTLHGVWEAAGSPLVSGGNSVCGVRVTDTPGAAMDGADVYIDFTRPDPSLDHARIAADLGVAGVVGTTGFDASFTELFGNAAATIPLVVAPNMSVGVNLLLRLVRTAAATLGPDYNPEILDIHHRWKVDAPSGTAKALLGAVRESRGERDRIVHGREGHTGQRPDDEVGVHTMRMGDVIGDHTVYLAGPGERIELTHRATSRDTFVHGALRAARWLAGRAPGLYGMEHVLGWTEEA